MDTIISLAGKDGLKEINLETVIEKQLLLVHFIGADHSCDWTVDRETANELFPKSTVQPRDLFLHGGGSLHGEGPDGEYDIQVMEWEGEANFNIIIIEGDEEYVIDGFLTMEDWALFVDQIRSFFSL